MFLPFCNRLRAQIIIAKNTKMYLSTAFSKRNKEQSPNQDAIDFIEKDSDYQSLLDKYLDTSTHHKCFVIHPHIKWGPQKNRTSIPQLQLQEGIALVNSLQTWKIVDNIIIPLENFHKKTLFGTGSLKRVTDKIKTNSSVTSVFINVANLKNIQLVELEKQFRVPIFDRYNIVMQIFRLHAISKHAKLQVALAELPFLRNRLQKYDINFITSSDTDTRNFVLQNREKKLREAINKLKLQRELLRNKRNKTEFPVIAVVGYTNAGKTSLIKALTGDNNLIPEDKLFATLDITFHAGILPSNMKILYVDTVGFLSDIPTELIECFRATLEDAILADVILHVEDISHNDFLHQRKHVMTTLKNLSSKMGIINIEEKIINVGNKYDLQNNFNEPILKVSAVNETGIDILKQKLEEKVLEITNRHIITISLPTGGEEVRWLYKNATVILVEEDTENSQNNIVKAIISEKKLRQFQYNFAS